MLIFDPLFSKTGNINLNNDNEIRTVTDELNRLAEKHDCAIVGVRHIGKSKGFGDPRNAGLNGVGWRAGARTHALVGKNPDDDSQRAIVQTKNNLAPIRTGSIGFKVEGGICDWTGESSLTADVMLSYKQSESLEERGAKAEAKTFLEGILADGPIGSQAVIDAARQAGISEKTLQRAKKAIGVVSKKDSTFVGGWFWKLPDNEDGQSKMANEDGHTNGNGHLRVTDANKPISSNNLSEDGQSGNSDHLGGHVANKGWERCSVCNGDKWVGKPCGYCEARQAAVV
jgi:hypothetical protein